MSICSCFHYSVVPIVVFQCFILISLFHKLLTTFSFDFCSSSEERGGRTGSGCSQLDDQAAYDLLVESYPVTVDGAAPKRSVRASLTGVHERYCYDRWRGDQLQSRVQHVLGTSF